MIYKILKELDEYKNTCPVTQLEDGCVTFLRNQSFFKYVQNTDKNIAVIINKEMASVEFPSNVKVLLVDDVDYAFTIFHNHIYKNSKPKKNIIGKRCRIHSSAIIGVEGIRFASDPSGKKIQLIHVGDVIIGNDVEVGANSIIHRGGMASTIIEDGVKIGVMVNIGHNNFIGENTVVVGGSIIAGSVNVGKNCWICAGTLIRNGISICDNVIVGMGSMVIKDITEPGTYFGHPAVRQGEYDPNFNL